MQTKTPGEGIHSGGVLKRLAAFWFATALAGLLLSAAMPAEQPAVQGKLIIRNGAPVIVEEDGKELRLHSADDSMADTLADARLSGRELKLTGHSGPDGTFQVEDFYVVHGNTLFRLIYFCDTCHITTFRPGKCQCCQQPTVPVEVPLTDPRVRREN